MNSVEKLMEILKQTELEKQKLEKEYQNKLDEKERTIKFIKKAIEQEKAKNEQSTQEESINRITIEDKIKECEEKGLKVERNRTWLWAYGFDGRYDENVTVDVGGKLGKIDLIDKNKEIEVLKELGFQYSSNRMRWYYIHS